MIRLPDTQPIPDEALNAYVDGALTCDEAAQIALCAASDPGTASRIALLHQLKAGVAGIADDLVMIDLPVPVRRRPWPRALPVATGALAVAALVALVALSFSWLTPGADGPVVPAAGRFAGSTDDTALERFILRHDAWIGMDAQAAGPHSVGDWLEDLMRQTGLRLVHHALPRPDDTDQSQQFSFVGPNGCRLSLFEAASLPHRSAPFNVMINDGLLTASWALEGRRYAMVARNMDSTRFATISAVVHEASRDRGAVDALALVSLQQARQPCLG